MKRILIFLTCLTLGMTGYSQTVNDDGEPVDLTIINEGQCTPIKKAPAQMPRVYLADHLMRVHYMQDSMPLMTLRIYNDMGEIIFEATNAISGVWTIPLTDEVWQEMFYIHLIIGNRVFYGMI